MSKEPKFKNLTGIIIIIGAAISIVSLYLLLLNPIPKKPEAGKTNIESADTTLGGNFELTDQNGQLFNSNRLKGKFSVIYFGFTYCPDICPTTLQKLTDVIETLDKYKIDVTPVFITIDPQRDKPELLKEYLGHFHPKFIGLSGTEEQIKKVADLFKVYYAEATTGDKEHYMMDHSSFVYLMDKKGHYLKLFYLDSSAKEIIEFIRIQNNR